MRKLMLLVAAIAAMTALTALTVSASADPTAQSDGSGIIRDEKICNGPAILRTAPEASGGWAGEMSDGEYFGDISDSANNFDYGYAYGHNHIYAYINRNYFCK